MKKGVITALLFVLLGLYFFRSFEPLPSTDTYFHLSIGRWVWQNRQIPKYDTFTFIAEGKEWISNEWLSGVILYSIYSKFGDTGILAARVLVGLLTLFFILKTLESLKIKFHLQILAILTIGVAVSFRLLDRPEMFSFLIFALLYFLLEKYLLTRSVKFLLFLPLIFLCWANIQGYAPIGIVLFGYIIAREITKKFDQNRLLVPAIISQKKLIIFFGLSVLAATFNIGQFQRFFYAFYLNKDLFKVVTEVEPLHRRLQDIKYDFWQNLPLEIPLYITITALGFLSIASRLTKHNFTALVDLAFFAFIMGLGYKFFRVIPLSLLLTIPVVAKTLNGQFVARETWYFNKKITGFVSGLLLAMIIVSIIQGKIVGYNASYLFVFDKQGQIVAAASQSWKDKKPTSATEFVKNHLEPKRILSSLIWNNYMLWVFDQKVKVFADIIYEKQTPESLTDYKKLSAGQDGWQDALEKYQPDLVINSQPLNVLDLFEVPIWQDKKWHLVYVDDVATVWAKDEQIKDKSLILEALKPYLASDFKFDQKDMAKAQEELQKLLAFNPKNAFALNQLILINLSNKNYQEAEKLAEESIRLLPKDPNFPFLLAAAKAAHGDCSKVAQPLSQAKRLADGFYNIRREIEKVASSCHLSI